MFQGKKCHLKFDTSDTDKTDDEEQSKKRRRRRGKLNNTQDIRERACAGTVTR